MQHSNSVTDVRQPSRPANLAATRSRQPVEFQLDPVASKLCGWAAPKAAERAEDELSLTIMLGSTALGAIRRDQPRQDVDRHLGYVGPATGFRVSDFGLALFAHITGIDAAIVTGGRNVEPRRYRLPLEENAELRLEPLGSRKGTGKSARLVDLWLESNRNLSLRFEGGGTLALDAYQVEPGSKPRLIQVAANRRVGGPLSLTTIALLNPFLPLLLVFKGEDRMIEIVDLVPFPSLVRGGMHEAERLMAGHGGDDLADSATVSAELLRDLLHRLDRSPGCVTKIDLDPMVETGLEPMLCDDLLVWLGDYLGNAVTIDTPRGTRPAPAFIKEAIARHTPRKAMPGHTLRLPADMIPTIAACLKSVPADAHEQTVAGGFGVIEWSRHGRIWSVWLPPFDAPLEKLQLKNSRRSVPALRVSSDKNRGSGQAVVPDWPLALALREKPTRKVIETLFETSEELNLPLIRDNAKVATDLSVLVLFGQDSASPLLLLQSLKQQRSIGRLQVIVVRPEGKDHPGIAAELESLFPAEHSLVKQPRTTGKLDQIAATRDLLSRDNVVVLDAATMVPDARTLATLVAVLSVGGASTAGCLVRSADGERVPLSAGYALSGISLRGTPAMSFEPIDPAALRQPATYPVVANSSAALIAKASLLQDVPHHGSTPARPELDDLLLGLNGIEQGGLNLCTTLVSVYSTAPAPPPAQLGLSLPYRLSPEMLSRLAESSTIVQMIR